MKKKKNSKRSEHNRKARQHERSLRSRARGGLGQRMSEWHPGSTPLLGMTTKGVRMSEVLEEFIEPYKESASTIEACRSLLSVAIVVWNLALLPEQERDGVFQKVLADFLSDADRVVMCGLVQELLERKQKHFAQYRREILDFELTDTGSGWHLDVMSTLDGPKPV